MPKALKSFSPATFIFAVLCIAMWIYFAYYFPYSFNYVVSRKHYYLLYFIAGGSLLLTTVVSSISPVHLLIASGLLLVLSFSQHYSIANEHYAAWLLLYLLGLIICVVLNRETIHVFLLFFLLVYVHQLSIGLIQLFTGNHYLEITGTLLNSGIYCCYLVAGLPLMEYLLLGPANSSLVHQWVFKLPPAVRKSILLLLLTGATVIIIYARSRAAVLAGVAILTPEIIAFLSRKRSRLQMSSRKVMVITGMIIGTLAITLAFLTKQMSATGRLLGWTIASAHVGDHPWWGTGPGRFTWYYPQWQANYFQQNPLSPAYFKESAGESYLIFNEYLQMLLEAGITGLLLFMIITVKCLVTKNDSEPGLTRRAKQTIIAILVIAFISYPFHSTVLSYLFIACLAIVFRKTSAHAMGRFSLPKHFPAWLFSGVVLLTSFLAVRTLMKVQQLSGIKAFEENYNDFRKDGKLLALYADVVLETNRDTARALQLYELAQQHFINREIMLNSAILNKQTGNFGKAEYYFTWLSNFTPNRFGPKFELLQLYKDHGDTGKALNMAHEIENMPVKISSEEVNNIKMQTKDILAQLNKALK
jgi:O-antigen ligase